MADFALAPGEVVAPNREALLAPLTPDLIAVAGLPVPGPESLPSRR